MNRHPPDEMLQLVQRQLVHLLTPVRTADMPSLYYYCETGLIEPMSSGEIKISPGGRSDVPNTAYEMMTSKLRELGLEVVTPRFTAENDYMDVRFEIRLKTGIPGVWECKFAAPWYVDLYCQSNDAPTEVADLLRKASDVQALGTFIFRGEPDLYPSVRSTLARHWNTDSAEALRILTERDLHTARQHLPDEQYEDLDLATIIQHMGGKTNLVDFTTEIWVALFFACLDEREPPRTSNTGRVYALDRETAQRELNGRLLEHYTSHTSHNRWEQQAGAVVVPETGIVPAVNLKEVMRIPPHCKETVNQFLRSIGVSIETMFNDIEGYVKYRQNHIPIPAICHIVVKHIENHEYIPALAIAESLIERHNRYDTANEGEGYYLRGLCHAAQGRLRQAERSLATFIEVRKRGNNPVPKYVERNLKLVRIALAQNRKSSDDCIADNKLERLRRRLVFEVDSELWSFTLHGYTVRE